MVKKIFKNFAIICLILFSLKSFSQDYYFDAIAFKSDSLEFDGRVDCFVLIPYKDIVFNQKAGKYKATVTINLDIYSNGKTFENFQIKKRVVSEDYYQSQGGRGDFYKYSHSFYLPSGNYEIKSSIYQNSGKELNRKTRKVNILPHNNYDRTLSALMLLSSIEENNGKLNITPYFSDNVSGIKEGFFSFFEIYTKIPNDEVSLVYQLLDTNEKVLETGKNKNITLEKDRNQEFLFIKPADNNYLGKYLLKIILLKDHDSDVMLESNYLAVAERSINFTPSFYSNILTDLNLAIRQLRYVASGNQISFIENQRTDAEKLDAYIEFWNSIDPTPNTKNNEAFTEYYKRINLANDRYRSTSDGWLTDMGRIFIVLGEPDQVFNDNQSMSSRATFIRWFYNNGREFIFEDRNGFGDFRLVRPMSFTLLYEYGNN